MSGPSGRPDPLVERALVERARTDRAAFAELYRMHVHAVHAFAWRRGGSREVADEATSATFERALRSFHQFEWRGEGMRPWLFRIASNEVAEIHRRRARLDGRRGQLALLSLVGDGVEAPVGDGDETGGIFGDGTGGPEARLLHQAIDRLSPRARDVISLRYLAGLSTDQVAEHLGCTKAALAVVLHRAMKSLRVELDRLTAATRDSSGDRSLR